MGMTGEKYLNIFVITVHRFGSYYLIEYFAKIYYIFFNEYHVILNIFIELSGTILLKSVEAVIIYTF